MFFIFQGKFFRSLKTQSLARNVMVDAAVAPLTPPRPALRTRTYVLSRFQNNTLSGTAVTQMDL